MKEKINPKVDYWTVTAILPVNQGKLYRAAFSPDNEDILEILYRNWTDATWLTEFFRENKKDLEAITEPMSTKKARLKVKQEADQLFGQLMNLKDRDLPGFFKPLHNKEADMPIYDFQLCKARVSEPRAWLRLYAVHIEGMYFITGGAIKLRDKMDRKYLKDEIGKMNALIKKLKDES